MCVARKCLGAVPQCTSSQQRRGEPSTVFRPTLIPALQRAHATAWQLRSKSQVTTFVDVGTTGSWPLCAFTVGGKTCPGRVPDRVVRQQRSARRELLFSWRCAIKREVQHPGSGNCRHLSPTLSAGTITTGEVCSFPPPLLRNFHPPPTRFTAMRARSCTDSSQTPPPRP